MQFFLATFQAVFMNHLQTFPWLSHLKANWEAIRDELLCFVEQGCGMSNVYTTGGEELNKESKWKLSMILAYGEPIEELLSLDSLHFGGAFRSSECCILAPKAGWFHPTVSWLNCVHSPLPPRFDCPG